MEKLKQNLGFVWWASRLGRQAGRVEEAQQPSPPEHGPWTEEHEEKAGEAWRMTSRAFSVVGMKGAKKGISRSVVKIAELAFVARLDSGRRSYAKDRRRRTRKLRRDYDAGREIVIGGYRVRGGKK